MQNWEKYTINRIKGLTPNHQEVLEMVESSYLDNHLYVISKKSELRSAVASLIQIKKNYKDQLAILFGDALKSNYEFVSHYNSFKNKVDTVFLDNVDPLILDEPSLDRNFIHLGYDTDHNLEIFKKFKRLNIGE